MPTLVTLLAAFLSTSASAQDLEPRRYVNVPIKQNFVRVAGGYSTGEVEVSPGIAVEDADLSMAGASLAYLRTFGLGGKAASVDLYVPYFCAEGSALIQGERGSRNTCGLGDARLRATYNFIGAPATDLNDFLKTPTTVVVGASFQVQAPTGAYDADRLLNIGANRWVFRPEIGMSVPLGKWSMEISAGARFFEDNDEFLVDSTSAQDPLYNLQVHAVYTFSRKQWLALMGNYFFGGETFRNGNPTQLRQENSRLGLVWNIAFDSRNLIQVNASRGVITRVGNDSTNVGVAWLHRWE